MEALTAYTYFGIDPAAGTSAAPWPYLDSSPAPGFRRRVRM